MHIENRGRKEGEQRLSRAARTEVHHALAKSTVRFLRYLYWWTICIKFHTDIGQTECTNVDGEETHAEEPWSLVSTVSVHDRDSRPRRRDAAPERSEIRLDRANDCATQQLT